MTFAPLGTSARRTAALLAAAVLLVSGCSGQEPGGKPQAAPGGTDASSSATPAGQQSVPPGDPGVNAPAVPDPGAGSDGPDLGGARREVPPSALLTASTVRSVVGGTWSRHESSGDACVIAEGAVGLSSVSYTGADRGVVVETVATYPSKPEADSAVGRMAETAADCGWTKAADPRLGSASVAAKDGSRSLVAVSTEGVVVMLVGSGKVARDDGTWASLVDLALGSSCPATTEGCH